VGLHLLGIIDSTTDSASLLFLVASEKHSFDPSVKNQDVLA
jgi:hypothetical protein